jgi:tRNA synthetases class I (I, L, M and V)
MAAQAVAEVREGRLKIEPPVHEKTWYRWLENARDWCVSRQVTNNSNYQKDSTVPVDCNVTVSSLTLCAL